ncbi:MAG: 4-hydroxy-3-methylbut-2-enyl diphosphate reductase [Alistipes sp.]|nr:4-hydroxy-3-methylbut-2-enyl diphosphate reductase [Alistipes sp.]
MKIEIDDKSGFCFGVVKAITKAEESLSTLGRVYSLGDIVHNRVEVQRLERLGLETISRDRFEALSGATVLIRAHGEPPETYRLAQQYQIRLIDATCPVVAHLQTLVVKAHEAMRATQGQVVILGKRGHAEVVGLTGQVHEEALVVETLADLEAIDFTHPIYLLSQTTQSLALFEQVRQEILRRALHPEQVTVNDTICRQVSNRNPHLREFAQRFDVVLFVCGRKSSNGKVLYEVCRESNPRCYNIEDQQELQSAWFQGCDSVGICGATSTPKWLMQQVADAVLALTSSAEG